MSLKILIMLIKTGTSNLLNILKYLRHISLRPKLNQMLFLKITLLLFTFMYRVAGMYNLFANQFIKKKHIYNTLRALKAFTHP